MFILATINIFAVLWSSFVWGVAGVGAGLLAVIPVGGIFEALTGDREAANRWTTFVVCAIILIAIISGGMQELNEQIYQSR
ncbi:hypothetical protein AM228_19775 [Planktothricoides sp. SR001]|uniref:hypothetical protein n=1 Tax=Planktothricoides sp. SR001 TaxID=1705388 RepID=UPI0006C3A45B|nr:hypothetical protein [Planktothricoides sp. SR001]KOR35160.1 hypothetical protein AM228_19775 [Planktothricoides sp. SR001]